jgi:hypothetical protein
MYYSGGVLKPGTPKKIDGYTRDPRGNKLIDRICQGCGRHDWVRERKIPTKFCRDCISAQLPGHGTEGAAIRWDNPESEKERAEMRVTFVCEWCREPFVLLKSAFNNPKRMGRFCCADHYHLWQKDFAFTKGRRSRRGIRIPNKELIR